MMISAASGFIYQSKKYSRDNAGKSLKKYTLLKKGELAYNHGASKLKQYGCCFELLVDEARIPYVYHTFKISEKQYTPYIALLLNNPIIDRQLKKLVSSSVRMDGLLNISYGEYTSITLNLPSYDEQQKIAAFLTLLDKRISKQRELVESLKSYKRGVLKNIFSSISQFRKLQDVSEYITSDMSLESIGNKSSGRFPVYDASGISLYISDYRMESDYIAIIKDGSGVGRLQYCKGKSSFIGTLGGIVANGCSTAYLYAAMQIIDFRQFVTGATIPHIYYKDYKNMAIPFPDIETQRKIERISELLDRDIAIADEKLCLLNRLKAGLLQKLFI